MKKISKKGQIWAIDAAIALVLFVGIILLFYRFAISYTPDYSQFNNMVKEGSYVSNTLLGTGYPPNWSITDDSDDVYSIGLIDSGFLNVSKVNKFREWAGDGNPNQAHYSELKSKINTRYNYYINFSQGNSFPLDSIGWAFENQGAKQVIKIQRLVLYNDSGQVMPIKLNVYLWTNESA